MSIFGGGGFLDIVNKKQNGGDYAGDEFGGGAGHDGGGMPTASASNFM